VESDLESLVDLSTENFYHFFPPSFQIAQVPSKQKLILHKQDLKDQILLIGGRNSNNILAIANSLRCLSSHLDLPKNKLKPFFFLLSGNKPDEISQNFALSSMFLENPQDIVWVPRDQWNNVNSLTKQYAADKQVDSSLPNAE
jgi:ubiquitin C-terminal hydrolase